VKTSWSIDYLNARYGNWNHWRREQQKRLEARTGVKWSTWHAHGKAVFAPCWTKETPECIDDVAMEKVMGVLDHRARAMYAVVFLRLVEETGLALADVISAAKTLCKQSRVVAVSCRMGQAIGIYRSKR